MNPYLQLSLGEFLDEVAADQPAPGAGSVAGVVVALAAGLVAMAARRTSDAWAEEIVTRAEQIRAQVAPLAQADAEAYARVIVATRLPRDDPTRTDEIRAALSGACEVPLAVAGHAAEVVTLAVALAERGNPRLRGEAITAAALAETATHAAATLIQLNLSSGEGPSGGEDPRAAQAALLVGQARQEASRVILTL